MEENVTQSIVAFLSLKHCKNALAYRVILTEKQSRIIAILIGIVILPSLLTNGLLLFAMMKTKRKELACRTYVILTSFCGCLNSVSGIPMYVLLFTTYHNTRYCLFERISIFTVLTNAYVLVYSVLVLAIDRYLNVRPGFGWSKRLARVMRSNNGTIVVCVSIVLMSMLHSLMSASFFISVNFTIGKYITVALNCFIACGVYVAYLKLYCEINAHNNSFRREFDANEASQGKTPPYVHEFIKTVAILLVAGVLCYLPFIIMDIWTGWYTMVQTTVAPQTVRFVYYLAVIPVLMHSSINSMLFLYRNEKAKQYICKKFCYKNSNSMQRHNAEHPFLEHFSVNLIMKDMAPPVNNGSSTTTVKTTPLLSRAAFVLHPPSEELHLPHP